MTAHSTKLQIVPLARDSAAQAYPLVRSVLPGLSLKDWTSFVAGIGAKRRRGAPAGGVLVARTERGYLHGLLCYRVERDLAHRWRLEVDPFVAFEIGRRPDVAEALLAAADNVAAQHGCGAIHVALPQRWAEGNAPRSELLQAFAANGHEVTRIGLCKRVPGSPVRPPADGP